MNTYDYDLSNLEDKTEYVYVLECEDNKYYVGYTKHIHRRMSEHFNSSGSSWTKKYKPLKILEISFGDENVERLKTYQVMLKYGWKNVRGSCWSNIKLINPPLYVKLKLDEY